MTTSLQLLNDISDYLDYKEVNKLEFFESYQWQSDFYKAGKTKRFRMLMAANRVGKCICYNTLVDTPTGKIKVGDLFDNGSDFEVMAWDGSKQVIANAKAPFKKKGMHKCYKITMSDGQIIEAADHHRVLTGEGWRYVQHLYESFLDRPQSSLEYGQLAHASDDQHCMKTPPDYLGGYSLDSHPYDARPHSYQGIGQESTPLPVYARQHIAASCNLGDLPYTNKHSLLCSCVPPSSLYACLRASALFVGYSGYNALRIGQQLYGLLLKISQFLPVSSFQPQYNFLSGALGRDKELSLCNPVYMGDNKIVSINPIGFHEVYDFTVYEYGNYIAGDLIHHNTYSQAVEVAYHLTGIYPDHWEGIKFDFPPSIWALGVSGEQIRDVIQKELFGDYMPKQGFTGTGAVPKCHIGEIIPAMGTPRLAKEVKVKHISGGLSSLGFRSYTQGQHVLMGTAKDYIWIDEEPEDNEIVPQCTIRLTTGNKGKGGYMVMTLTPENGATELINQYTGDNIADSQYLLNVTWDDAPHLDEQAKKDILSNVPVWQHDMRSKGIPVLGEGMVYPVDDKDIICDPFQIPEYFKQCAAIDFGVSHPTAGAWMAYDADADIIYLTSVYRKGGSGEEIAAQHATAFNSKGRNIPVIYPHDGDNERGTGPTYRDMYTKDHGVNMHIKFSNEGESESNYVEPGLLYIYDRMITGRFKVFSSCKEFFDEKRRYHRKKSKIVKEFDDVMDAVRYAGCSVTRFGVTGKKRESNERMSPKLGRF